MNLQPLLSRFVPTHQHDLFPNHDQSLPFSFSWLHRNPPMVIGTSWWRGTYVTLQVTQGLDYMFMNVTCAFWPCSGSFPNVNSHCIMDNCCQTYRTLCLGLPDRTQLIMGNSKGIVTSCPMCKWSISKMPKYISFLLFLFRGWGEEQRGRERASSASSTLSTEPDMGLDPTTLGSWPEPKSRVECSFDWALQVPHSCFIFVVFKAL